MEAQMYISLWGRSAALLVCLAVAGCASQAQIAQQRAALDAADANACQSYGAPKGSEQYFRCRMELNAQHAQTALVQQQLDADQATAMMETGTALIAASGPHH
jgi:hypothetical protein